MDFRIINDEKINEKIYFGEHRSGLGVIIVPKKDFSKKYAIIGAKIGSVDNMFIPLGEEEPYSIPDGVAHFLEHKLFEQPDGSNAFDKFSMYGASANAYTSFTNTCYLFSCTDNFNESLDHLLSYVYEPYFTDENVSKEQGIIGQEIKMYDDDADWCVMFNLLKCLYNKCPVRIDIAGTVESISHITKDVLYKCYNTFYNPSNMVLCIAGDVDIDRVSEIIDKNLPEVKTGEAAVSLYPDEPQNICKKENIQNMSVSVPLFNIGFKDNELTKGDELVRNDIAADIILRTLFSKSSDLYYDMYREGLINDEFSYDSMYEEGFACVMVGGESRNPREVDRRIMEYISNKNEITQEEVERCKKAMWGSYMRSFNNVEAIARIFMQNVFRSNDPLSFERAFEEVSVDFVNKKYKSLFKEENKALSIVNPM